MNLEGVSVDVQKKAQMRQERELKSMYEGLNKEDIEYLEREDGGDDQEADAMDVPASMPGVSSEGTKEETRFAIVKKEE